MKYVLTYWTQRNDESTDIEIIIEANSIEEAEQIFLKINWVHSKIESIIRYDI